MKRWQTRRLDMKATAAKQRAIESLRRQRSQAVGAEGQEDQPLAVRRPRRH